MKVKFFKPAELDRNIKATIHKTGKLGFTSEAANKLNLSTDKGMFIGSNDENPEDTSLYAIIDEASTPDTFKISRAGEYYYLNTKDLFDNLNLDYQNKTIIYDIRQIEIEGKEGFVFRRREIDKTAKKD